MEQNIPLFHRPMSREISIPLKQSLQVLIVEDSENDAFLIIRELKKGGYQFNYERVETAESMNQALFENDWDIIIADYSLPHFSAPEALETLKKYNLDIPFIIVSGSVGEEKAIHVMKAGAHDYIMKDNLKRLVPAVERELREAEIRRLKKQSDEQIRIQLSRLASLRKIDISITSSPKLEDTLNIILNEIIAILHVDAADILLMNHEFNRLEFAVGRGFRSDALQHTQLKIGEGYAGRAALTRKTCFIRNLSKDMGYFSQSPHLEGEKFISYYGVPLITKGELKGILEVFHRSPLDPDNEWLEFLESLGGQTAIAIENATLMDDLQQSNFQIIHAYDETIEGWSKALDLRDKETEGHTIRVTEMTLHLAEAMKIDKQLQQHIRRGALLHDIGKMGIPDKILLKPGPLTDEEWVIMKKHPVYAFELLHPIKYLRPALEIPYCHHEKWDGSGYPRGLKEDEIPITARIFAVIDVWDALLSDRPYRPAWTKERALNFIQENAGSHFDKQVVDAFMVLQSSLK